MPLSKGRRRQFVVEPQRGGKRDFEPAAGSWGDETGLVAAGISGVSVSLRHVVSADYRGPAFRATTEVRTRGPNVSS